MKSLKKLIPRGQVVSIIDGDDELKKKHSRTSPDVQLTEFSLTKQKTRPSRTMSELVKPFLKKSDTKILKKKENQSYNAACEQKTPR